MATEVLIGFVVMGGLIVINTVGVAMVLLQMPGTWLIFLATAAAAWIRWEQSTIGWIPLAMLLLLAICGEIVETASTATTTRKAGGSWIATIVAMVGALFGAIAGQILIPIPVAGAVAGACAGAGLGAMSVTRIGGATWDDSRGVGVAAAKGRFWGTLAKVSVACLMWFVSLMAVLIP